MSEQHGPPPLKAGKGARPELRDALHALGKQDVDTARLARVAEKLGPLLEGTAPALGSTLLRHAQRKLLYGRLAMAALAIGAIGATAAVWLQRAPATPVAQPARERTVQTSPPVSAPAPPSEPVPEVLPSAPPALPVATKLAPARVPPRRGERAARARAAAVPSTTPELVSTPDTSGTTNERSTQPESALTPQPEVAPPEQPEPARSLSEVDLLFEARKQMQRDPRAALALLDQHKTRFDDGQLAPEREVLAIEALRKLGQTAAATARLRAFRARYPDSLHLRRLEQP